MSAITFRGLTRDDLSLLATWLARPHVHRWWYQESLPAAVERDFGAAVDGQEPDDQLVTLFDGRPIGLVQVSRFADHPEYIEQLDGLVDVPESAASIDYLIGEPELVGRGIGTRMIRAIAEWIWSQDPPVSCLIVPVNTANVGSWTALLRAGFQLIARGDLEADNPADDPAHEILRLDRPG